MSNKTKEELALEAYMAGLNEKKLTVSDNRLIALNNRSKNSEWIKNHSDANIKRKEFGNSEEWKEFTRELNQRPEWKANNARANKKRNSNPNNVIAFEQGIKKRSENEEWLKNVRYAAQNRSEEWLESHRKRKAMEGTPIVTPEGAFLKFSDGVKYYMPIWNLKKGGADYRLRKLLNDNNIKDFYRISHEEYILLTGIDPTI